MSKIVSVTHVNGKCYLSVKPMQEEAIKKYLCIFTISTCKKWYDFNDLPLQKLWKAVFEERTVFRTEQNQYKSYSYNLMSLLHPHVTYSTNFTI